MIYASNKKTGKTSECTNKNNYEKRPEREELVKNACKKRRETTETNLR